MFGRRITLFKLFGFEVRLDASWLVIAALIIWTLTVGVFPFYYPGLPGTTYLWMGVLGAILLFLSIVIHELFHSLVARQYGIPMKGITLFVFGGIAEMGGEPQSPKAEFLMAIAGPAASVILGFIFYGITKAIQAGPVEWIAVLAYLARINWALAVFNMIPAFPLDGGRVLRSALWHYKGDLRRATRTASSIGSGFGVVLMAIAVVELFFGNLITAVWWFLIGMFLRSVALSSYEQLLVQSALQGEPVRRYMNTHPDTVSPNTSIEQLVQDHMYRYHHRMFPVLTENQTLEGCVTSEQVKAVPREEWAQHTVEEITRPCSPENTISPDTDSVEALKLMQKSQNTRLMVVEAGRLVAIVALKDLMAFLTTKLELQGESPKLRTV